jgi:arginyl-tRNA synthetase
VEEDLLPHRLCDYAFELSGKFNQFYESCPVNNAPTAELRESRVALCTVAASTLRLVLELLGIPTLEQL